MSNIRAFQKQASICPLPSSVLMCYCCHTSHFAICDKPLNVLLLFLRNYLLKKSKMKKNASHIYSHTSFLCFSFSSVYLCFNLVSFSFCVKKFLQHTLYCQSTETKFFHFCFYFTLEIYFLCIQNFRYPFFPSQHFKGVILLSYRVSEKKVCSKFDHCFLYETCFLPLVDYKIFLFNIGFQQLEYDVPLTGFLYV